MAPLRKAIPGRTIFNLIGPLLNPVNPPLRILGTATKESQQAIADYLLSYTSNKNSFVVRADSGIDELDPSSNNSILTVTHSSIVPSILSSSIAKQTINSVSLTVSENVRLFKHVISDFSSAPLYLRSLITLNAGAGFFLDGKSKKYR